MSDQLLARQYVEFASKGITEIADQLDVIYKRLKRAEEGNRMLQRALASGAYAQHARWIAQINREYERLHSLARRQDLVAQFGRVGGSIRFAQEQMSGFVNAARLGFGIVTASTMGWVTAGLQGTREAKQLAIGFQLVSQQIAGVFKPVIDTVIDKLFALYRWFRSLSGEEQATIRKTILWTAGLLGAVLAVNLLAKALAAVVLAATRVGTALKWMTGVSVATTAAAGALNTGAAAAGLAGAGALYKGAGGAAGGLGAAGLFGAGAAGAGGAKALLKGLGGIAVALIADELSKATTGGGLVDWADRGARGWKMGVRNTFGRLFYSQNEVDRMDRYDILRSRENFGKLTDKEQKELDSLRIERGDDPRYGAKEGRQDVTPDFSGFSEIGESRDRFSMALLDFGTKGNPQQETADTLARMETLLNGIAGGIMAAVNKPPPTR